MGHTVANAMEYFVTAYEFNLQEAASLLMNIVMANSATFVASHHFVKLMTFGEKGQAAAQKIAQSLVR